MIRRYRIEHRTAYRYSDEVSTSFGRGYLRPRDMPGQRCLEHRLIVEPTPSDISHGDRCLRQRQHLLPRDAVAHRAVGGRAVRRRGDSADAGPAGAGPALGDAPGRPPPSIARSVEFTLASPLVRMPAQIRDYADVSFTPGRPIDRGGHRPHPPDLHRVQVRVGRDLGVVDRHRCAGRQGRCLPGLRAPGGRQPALARAGLPVRLRLPGHPPAAGQAADDRGGRQPCLGGGSAGRQHLARRSTRPTTPWPTSGTPRVAWGRDYDDVPPLRGVIYTDAEGTQDGRLGRRRAAAR